MSEGPTTQPTPTDDEILVGGQALIEGVLMRSPRGYGIAVRRPDGEIVLSSGEVKPLARRWRFLRLPLLRGLVVLGRSLALGIRALNYSAAQQIEEEPHKEEKSSGSKWALAGSIVFGLGLGVALFVLLPLWLSQLLDHWAAGQLSSLGYNLIDGAFRAVLFFIYLFAISRFPDIQRVFMYHGAEHKTVFAYETGDELDVALARRQSRFHPRCGTSFLLFILILSIFAFALIPKSEPFLLKSGARLILLPLLAGLSYELLRWTAAHKARPLFRLLVAPGLFLQRITTREPSDDMLEVAIAALNAALDAEKESAQPAVAEPAEVEALTGT